MIPTNVCVFFLFFGIQSEADELSLDPRLLENGRIFVFFSWLILKNYVLCVCVQFVVWFSFHLETFCLLAWYVGLFGWMHFMIECAWFHLEGDLHILECCFERLALGSLEMTEDSDGRLKDRLFTWELENELNWPIEEPSDDHSLTPVMHRKSQLTGFIKKFVEMSGQMGYFEGSVNGLILKSIIAETFENAMIDQKVNQRFHQRPDQFWSRI